MNVLIVDDSLIMRRVIRGAIKNYFEEVTILEAKNGPVACKNRKKQPC